MGNDIIIGDCEFKSVQSFGKKIRNEDTLAVQQTVPLDHFKGRAQASADDNKTALPA